jgi:hypothetical protein
MPPSFKDIMKQSLASKQNESSNASTAGNLTDIPIVTSIRSRIEKLRFKSSLESASKFGLSKTAKKPLETDVTLSEDEDEGMMLAQKLYGLLMESKAQDTGMEQHLPNNTFILEETCDALRLTLLPAEGGSGDILDETASSSTSLIRVDSLDSLKFYSRRRKRNMPA